MCCWAQCPRQVTLTALSRQQRRSRDESIPQGEDVAAAPHNERQNQQKAREKGNCHKMLSCATTEQHLLTGQDCFQHPVLKPLTFSIFQVNIKLVRSVSCLHFNNLHTCFSPFLFLSFQLSQCPPRRQKIEEGQRPERIQSKFEDEGTRFQDPTAETVCDLTSSPAFVNSSQQEFIQVSLCPSPVDGDITFLIAGINTMILVDLKE